MSSTPKIQFRNYRPIDGSLGKFVVDSIGDLLLRQSGEMTEGEGIARTQHTNDDGDTEVTKQFLDSLALHAQGREGSTAVRKRQRDLDKVLEPWDDVLAERTERKIVLTIQEK